MIDKTRVGAAIDKRLRRKKRNVRNHARELLTALWRKHSWEGFYADLGLVKEAQYLLRLGEGLEG